MYISALHYNASLIVARNVATLNAIEMNIYKTANLCDLLEINSRGDVVWKYARLAR